MCLQLAGGIVQLQVTTTCLSLDLLKVILKLWPKTEEAVEATKFIPFVSVSSHNMLTETEIYVLIWGFYYVTDIGNQYQKEYQKAVDSCGYYTRYTNVDSYENLINIKEDIIQKITSCQSVNITTPGAYTLCNSIHQSFSVILCVI